ncbi:lipase family protein [Nocardia sp. NPDC003693]
MARGVLLPLVALALGAGVMAAPAPALPNTTDPFYTPPAEYEAAQPGEILRSRPIQASYFQAIPLPVQAWQLLYRTTKADGSPYAAVTTVLKRTGAEQPSTLLSFQNMIDAVAPHCAPSQILLQGQVPWIDPSSPGPIKLGTMANDTPLVVAALVRGMAVAVPDFGGIDNNFMTPRDPGFAVLDGIRAAEDFEPFGLPGRDTRALLWGYSGGAIASAWAAQEHPTYAPELDIAGAALGGPVGDPRATLEAINGKAMLGGLVPVVFSALVHESPTAAAALDRYLTPEGLQRVADAAGSCTPQNMAANYGFDLNRFLTVPLTDLLNDPVISAALEAMKLGTVAPSIPQYVYNSVEDEGALIAGVDDLVERYCAAGTPVTYRRETMPMPVSAHTLEWFIGAPAALAWLEARAADPADPTGCDVRTVPTTITDPEALNNLTAGIMAGPLRLLLGF